MVPFVGYDYGPKVWSESYPRIRQTAERSSKAVAH